MDYERLAIQAIKNLWARRGRSFLTSLGIIIGTATIVVIVGIGVASQRAIEEEYSNLSATTVQVSAGGGGGGGGPTAANVSKISLDDKDVILESSSTVASVVPQISGRTTITFGLNEPESTTVVGIPAEFKDTGNLSMQAGDFYSEADEDSKESSVVLGYSVAESLFENPEDAVSQFVQINNKEYEIVGVIEYRGGAIGRITIDDSIYMPFATAQRYILGRDARVSFLVDAVSVEYIPQLIEDVGYALRLSHDLKPEDADDFMIKDMGSLVTSAVSSAKTMTFLLSSVAGIVLLVGGIGIMNIMYVSVEERTKEIGIRKAVGAKSYHILAQFILEAAGISIGGGLIGAILAVLVIYIMKYFEYPVDFVTWGFLVGVLSSVIVGLFFGIYPAKKAGALRPIEALRHE